MTPKDFDRLSAYIDNQLSPAEKADLESRLARDNELRTALIELRLTVRALRALPAVKPPRSFTLTPAQAGLVERRRPMFPVLRLAAAMSALALFFAVAGDLALNGGAAPASSPAAESEMAAMTSGEAEDGTESVPPDDTRQAEVAIADAAPAVEQTGTAAAAEVESFDATAQSVIAAGGADAGTAGLDTPEPAMLAPNATPTQAGDGKSSPTPTETPEAVALVPPAAATEAVTAQDAAEAEETDLFYAEPDAGPPPGLSPLRMLQAGLAMLTVMLGLGAWFTRRSA